MITSSLSSSYQQNHTNENENENRWCLCVCVCVYNGELSCCRCVIGVTSLQRAQTILVVSVQPECISAPDRIEIGSSRSLSEFQCSWLARRQLNCVLLCLVRSACRWLLSPAVSAAFGPFADRMSSGSRAETRRPINQCVCR